jgi:hypothetical protein
LALMRALRWWEARSDRERDALILVAVLLLFVVVR